MQQKKISELLHQHPSPKIWRKSVQLINCSALEINKFSITISMLIKYFGIRKQLQDNQYSWLHSTEPQLQAVGGRGCRIGAILQRMTWQCYHRMAWFGETMLSPCSMVWWSVVWASGQWYGRGIAPQRIVWCGLHIILRYCKSRICEKLQSGRGIAVQGLTMLSLHGMGQSLQ